MGRARQRFDPVELVREHGMVLASARHRHVPNVAEAISGEPIRGSWWGHPRGQEIFQALNVIADSPDVLCFRLVDRKITFVHRRLWPALVRLHERLGDPSAVSQEHTESGAHRNVETPYPKWVPAETKRAAGRLSEEKALALLGVENAAAIGLGGT